MLRPSYNDLMDSVNANVVDGEQLVMNSRYGIVIATAKRAREIIAGAEVLVENSENKKPLSAAIEEIYTGKVHLVSDEVEDIVEDIQDSEEVEAEMDEEEVVEA